MYFTTASFLLSDSFPSWFFVYRGYVHKVAVESPDFYYFLNTAHTSSVLVVVGGFVYIVYIYY